MSRTFVVAGTDTNVGKTVFASALAGALDAHYWKPIQAGLEDGGDRAQVARLSGLGAHQLIPESYRLNTACSPHEAARIDGVEICEHRLGPPQPRANLVIEAAGGLMVPLGPQLLQIDLISRWGFPNILVARTTLGTINHSLLGIHAMRLRGITIVGVAFVGHPNEASEAAITNHGRVKRLGRLPWLETLDELSLRQAFSQNFDLSDFR